MFEFLSKVPEFFNWLIRFLRHPLGIAIWSIALVVSAGYYGDIQREKGEETNKHKVQMDSSRIVKLENKVYDLSEKLANRDCSSEVEKYMNLIQTLQIQSSQNRNDITKRLEIEKQKTRELENLKQSLNTN